MGLIKQPSELEVKQTLSILIYGQPGIGKTTLGCSSPNSVLFDYDGGVQRINGAHQVATVQIKSWEDTTEALKELETMPEIKTIVIDTVGKMLDYMALYIVKNDSKQGKRDGSLSLQGYGQRKTMFQNFIKQVFVSGKNIIFIAHEKEEKRGEEFVKRPEIGGSSANDLMKELDLVGYMQAIGKDRTITFDPTEQYYAKNTCSLPTITKLPVLIDENGVSIGANNYISSVIEAYKSAQLRNKEHIAEYEMLLDSVKSTLQEVKTIDEINSLVPKLQNLHHVMNSKMVCSKLLHEKAIGLGFKINSVSKLYEPKKPTLL